MESGADLSDRLVAALLATEPADPPRVLVSTDVAPMRVRCPSAVAVEPARVAETIRRRRGQVWAIAVARIEPSLARTLTDHPPALVIATESVEREVLAMLDRAAIRVLGPQAMFVVGDGSLVTCATSSGELEALLGVLDGDSSRLALAPTPGWLLDWLETANLRSLRVAGYVRSSQLDSGWARWAATSASRHVLVPLGVGRPDLDRPGDPALESAVAAHALERLTGPIFPAPRVIGLLLRDFSPPMGEPSVDALDLWNQARRALPMTGAVLGMEHPHPGLPLDAPTATFLAQRALLRRQERLDLAAQALASSPTVDVERRERAHEVLASAGQTLSDHESKVVLRGYGIEITRQAVASSVSGAAHYAETIGFPVVLKAVSPDLRRKQEIGAVVLDIRTGASARRAFATIAKNVELHAPTARLDGVLVAEMIEAGLDVHCGGLRMQDGDVALYGRALSAPAPIEPAFALSPLTAQDAMLFAHAILSRVPVPALRRQTDPDVRELAELLLRVDAVFRDSGDRLLHIDINPVRLERSGRGYVVLDARIVQRAHLEGL